MVPYVKKCPDCGGINLIFNKERGEITCKDCGLVVEEKVIDFTQEWREFEEEDSSMRRTGAPSTYSVDYIEPIIIKKDNFIEILPIGEFVDTLIRQNKDNLIEENSVEYVSINPDFEVVSFGQDYKIKFRPVTEVSRHPTDLVYEIKLETGRKVKVTGSHSVFTVKNNQVVPIMVEDLKKGDFIVAPLELPQIECRTTKINLLKEFIKLAKDDNIYLRGFYNETVFNEAKRKFGAEAVKNWKRHKTIPLYALKELKLNINNKDLKIGIYSGSNELPLEIELTPDFCKILGYYVAEGHAREHEITFSFGVNELDYINEVEKIMKDMFNIKGIQYSPHPSAIQLTYNSKLLAILFRDILKAGSNALTKRVPSIIYSLPKQYKLSFLIGYLNGDGSLVTNENEGNCSVRLSTSSVSEVLTNDILTLYSQLGFNAHYQEAYIPEHIIKKTGQLIKGSLATRSLIINPESAAKLGYLDNVPKNKHKGPIEKLIPAPQEYIKEWKFRKRIRIGRELALKIAEKFNDFNLKKLANSKFLFLRVTSKEKVKPTTGFVYDVSVPKCENFVGGRGGIFLHNTKHDKGLGTSIGKSADLYQLRGKQRDKYFRLKKWQHRISTAIERNLKLALSELKRVSSYLKLPDSVEEESARIYTLAVQRGLVRGRSMESVVAGALYAACRRHEVPRTLDELSEASGIDKKEIGRTYRFITRELGIRILPSNPVDYIPRFASALKLTAKSQSKAVEILEMAQKKELTSGRGPTGIAAASLYVAALANNEKRTQREVADVAGVTEVTIRNRYKELLKELGLKEELKKKL